MDTTQYTVREGDTLFGIAQFFRTTISDILNYNNINDPSNIFVGEKLTIPTGTAELEYYAVRPGDSLWTIAQRNNTTVQRLRELNGLYNHNIIYPGQILKIK